MIIEGETDRHPTAHTCFFHVDVPDYDSEEEFITKLMTAILECGTFDRV